jgi:5-methyltetrahydrofolate--homocysteine methyltransferase
MKTETPTPGEFLSWGYQPPAKPKKELSMTEKLASIRDAVIKGQRGPAVAGVKGALEQGAAAQTIMTEALIPAMEIVGEKYSKAEIFLPEMMVAARAMSEAVECLRPAFPQGGYAKKAKAVIGTVAGDLHDIGKNIVKMLLEGSGYEVLDLGTDVAPEAFVEAVRQESPRYVLMSTLITLTMESMNKTVQAIEAAGLRGGVVIGVGGAPVTPKYAQQIGADFYADDAHECVTLCNQLAG